MVRDGRGLIDLGLVPGSIESFAFDTDGQWVVGQLSGDITLGLTTRGFVWSETSAMKAITPASITARATHVANGRVVGFYAHPRRMARKPSCGKAGWTD